MDNAQLSNKSVRFSKEIDQRLSWLAGKHGRTKRLLVMQMVDYFYKTKKDPADLNDEVLKKELSIGVNRILSFIRKQEIDLLTPMYAGLQELHLFTAGLKGASNTIIQDQTILKIAASDSLTYVKLLNADVNALSQRISDREKLKNGFKNILEHYIAEREKLGWSASVAKKEQLNKQVRLALEKLS